MEDGASRISLLKKMRLRSSMEEVDEGGKDSEDESDEEKANTFEEGLSEDENEYNEDMDLFGRTESLDAGAMDAGEAAEVGDQGDAALGRLCALDHDLVFWMGDLNYRMAVEAKDDEVFELLRVVAAERESLEAGNVESAADMLLGYDQLNIERRNNRVFQGFHEGRTNFLPTYKYIPGDTETEWYDQRPDKKVRRY